MLSKTGNRKTEASHRQKAQSVPTETSHRQKAQSVPKSTVQLEAAPTPGPVDFRIRLQSELVNRCRANPSFSLRAFAKFLGVESGRLSKILRGERPVSAKLFKQIAQKLALSPVEVSQYGSAAVAKKHGIKDVPVPEQAFLQLSQDAFDSIEDWRHYAILELMKLDGFRSDLRYVARQVGVSLPEARAYVERLQRIGLLDISEGNWTDRSMGFSTHVLSEVQTSVAHRRSQIELLKLAQEAVENVPIERRDQSSMMMATHSSKLAEAKIKIKNFRRELCEFLEDCESKDTVYQLAVSLFPLIPAESNEDQSNQRNQ